MPRIGLAVVLALGLVAPLPGAGVDDAVVAVGAGGSVPRLRRQRRRGALRNVGGLILVLVAFATAPDGATAQQRAKAPRVGILFTGTPTAAAPFNEAARSGGVRATAR
jgi:hypothetical protein